MREHVDAICAITEHAVSEIGRHLQQILRQAEDQRAELDQLSEQILGNSPETLGRAVRDLVGCLSDARHGFESVEAEVKQVSDIATGLESESTHILGLTDRIRAIARAARLLALNARIEATRLGDANAAQVLATEMKGLSEEVAGTSHRIQTIADGLRRNLPTMASTSQELARRCGEQAATLRERESQLGASFESAQTLVRSMLQDSVRRGQEMKDSNMAIIGELGFQDVVRQRLQRLAPGSTLGGEPPREEPAAGAVAAGEMVLF